MSMLFMFNCNFNFLYCRFIMGKKVKEDKKLLSDDVVIIDL